MIEMNLLETLAAFDTYGTLSASSIHLHISQPALSRSMQKLEEELGVKLFERTKNRMALNSTGKLAASYARTILNMEKEMTTAVISHNRSLHTISVGYCAPSPRMEISNANGEFTLFLPVGEYEISVDANSLTKNVYTDFEPQTVKVVANETTQIPAIELKIKQRKIEVKRFGS